jgi:hypothetical protein
MRNIPGWKSYGVDDFYTDMHMPPSSPPPERREASARKLLVCTRLKSRQ